VISKRCSSSLRLRREATFVHGLGVLRDVYLVQPDLLVLYVGEPVDERGAAGPQRLDLGADEDDAGLPAVLEVVVVRVCRAYEPSHSSSPKGAPAAPSSQADTVRNGSWRYGFVAEPEPPHRARDAEFSAPQSVPRGPIRSSRRAGQRADRDADSGSRK
jgi:hypothetical protein